VAVNDSRRKLRDRWSSQQGRALQRAVLARLGSGGDLEDLELGQVDGRIDLRGLPLSDKVTSIESANIRAVDFSAAELAGLRMKGCVLEDCRFQASTCVDWRLWETSISNGNFEKADLRQSSLGAWSNGKGNEYSNVSFARANLAGVGTSAGIYIDCDFSEANLERINFWQSSLIRCKFAGKLVDVVFDGRHLGEGKSDCNPMLDVDFSRAEFDGCEFRGISFGRVILPPDPDLLIIDDLGIIDRAAASLPESDDDLSVRMARLIFGHARKLLQFGPVALLNLRDFQAGAELFVAALVAAGWKR
jgi:uncharacterized protein YjbI with pentapeptide repeats